MIKEDGRIRYTKLKIREAFFELLQTTPFEKITVTAVCSKAEINRATFYKHYLDVPDLAEKLQDEAIELLSDKINAIDKMSIEDFIVDILKFLHKDYCENNLWNKINILNPGSFTAKLTAIVYSKFSKIFEPYEKKNPSISSDMIFSYISAGSAGLIDYWVKSGFRESEKTMAKTIIKLSASTLKSL